jgi:hypothetical protein
MKMMFGLFASGPRAFDIEVPAQPGNVNDAIDRLTAFKKSRRFMSCLIDTSAG